MYISHVYNLYIYITCILKKHELCNIIYRIVFHFCVCGQSHSSNRLLDNSKPLSSGSALNTLKQKTTDIQSWC